MCLIDIDIYIIYTHTHTQIHTHIHTYKQSIHYRILPPNPHYRNQLKLSYLQCYQLCRNGACHKRLFRDSILNFLVITMFFGSDNGWKEIDDHIFFASITETDLYLVYQALICIIA